MQASFEVSIYGPDCDGRAEIVADHGAVYGASAMTGASSARLMEGACSIPILAAHQGSTGPKRAQITAADPRTMVVLSGRSSVNEHQTPPSFRSHLEDMTSMTTRDYWYEGDEVWLRGGDQPDRDTELQLMTDEGWVLLTTTTYPDRDRTWHVLDTWAHP